ncbi:MAG: hypothetical protein KAI47_12995, partial [Deltaproteobacteria bacterium]|nr:hypothetical protein [Deltaproteobacteria bacterium]
MSTASPQENTAAAHGAGGLIFTAAYLVAMLLLFIGERLIGESSGSRVGLAIVAFVGLLFAIVGRLRRRRVVGEGARPIEKRILGLYLLGLVALLLYAAQADFVMDRLRPLFAEPRSA